jgi:hypothetical protein
VKVNKIVDNALGKKCVARRNVLPNVQIKQTYKPAAVPEVVGI